MALQGVYTLNSPVVSTDTTLPVAVRDALLRDAPNDGVRFIADLGFGFCYPGGQPIGRPDPAAPVNGAVVYDVAERANGSVVEVAGQSIGYAGGGFDFSAITVRNNFLEIPASVAADLYTAYGGSSQQFLVCLYVKLPSSANWNPNATFAPFIQWATTNYVDGPDIFALGQANTPSLLMARQTAGATVQNVNVTDLAPHYGKFAQLAVWRTASETGVRIKSSGGTSTVTAAAGSQNSGDFSAQTGKIGTAGTFWREPIGTQATAVNWRLYRAFVENLARSGRTPATVLDADYARVVVRAAVS